MDEFTESRSAPPPKPSKIPSWIMLGFLLGALFVWAWPRAQEPAPPTPEPAAVRPVLPPVPTHPRLTDVEDMFATWGKYAVWADDTTYISMWDIESRTFRDCFEVLRRGDDLFFRNIPRPKNLRLLDGIPPDSALEFFNPVPEARGLFGERITPPAIDRSSR